jgi:hypothetical protein
MPPNPAPCPAVSAVPHHSMASEVGSWEPGSTAPFSIPEQGAIHQLQDLFLFLSPAETGLLKCGLVVTENSILVLKSLMFLLVMNGCINFCDTG